MHMCIMTLLSRISVCTHMCMLYTYCHSHACDLHLDVSTHVHIYTHTNIYAYTHA